MGQYEDMSRRPTGKIEMPIHISTSLIPPSAFKVLCKFIFKKQFIISFKVIFNYKVHEVISNSFARISTQINYQVIKNYWVQWCRGKFLLDVFAFHFGLVPFRYVPSSILARRLIKFLLVVFLFFLLLLLRCHKHTNG